MERLTVSGAAHEPPGARFSIIGISSAPTDWARIFRALASGSVNIETLLESGPDAMCATHATPGTQRTSDGGADTADASAPQALSPQAPSTTPPSVLNLNAYLLYATGKASRRRLTEKLTAHGLRLWHLTVLATLADLGPQSKGHLAARLDMHASDLVKIVNDLDAAGHLVCVRDPADRRRVVVELTQEGRAALARLNTDIASADDDLLAPLTEAERSQFSSLLRRVHGHLAAVPAGDAHDHADRAVDDGTDPAAQDRAR